MTGCTMKLHRAHTIQFPTSTKPEWDDGFFISNKDFKTCAYRVLNGVGSEFVVSEQMFRFYLGCYIIYLCHCRV